MAKGKPEADLAHAIVRIPQRTIKHAQTGIGSSSNCTRIAQRRVKSAEKFFMRPKTVCRREKSITPRARRDVICDQDGWRINIAEHLLGYTAFSFELGHS